MTFELRQQIAVFRMEKARRAKRRAQWRESARRRRAAKLAERHGAVVVGYLHSLACHTRYHHSGNAKCVPIPCFDRPVAP